MDRTPSRLVERTARQSVLRVLAITVSVLSVGVATATPTSAASKSSTKPAGDDRIEMPTRKLPPSVRAKRALGAVYVDVVNTTFDVQIGKRTIGRVGGVVDLAGSGADLRYLSINTDGKLSSDPFLIRVRGDRIQVRLPADLRKEVGVDGYVTSKTEGSFAGVGVSDEVILAIALLTSLPIPRTVSSWSEKTSGTTGPSLRGIATREDFSIFSPERFGSTADVEVRLRPSGTLRDLSISYTPVKAAKADGAVAIKLVGTVARSAKTLNAKAPTGEFVTAAKLFDLAPVPESTPDSASVAIEGDV
jgi:hypothetical protein